MKLYPKILKLGTQDNGASPYIFIPRAFARLFNWQKGDEIEITPDTKKQTLTLRKR
jgi:hypothetical protein